MKSKSEQSQCDLFKIELGKILDMSHYYIKLSNSIDWKAFCEKVNSQFSDSKGRRAKDTRLMIALQILKLISGFSDEKVLDMWLQNPYWQYLSGCRFFEYKIEIASSTMSSWRKRFQKSDVLFEIENIVLRSKPMLEFDISKTFRNKKTLCRVLHKVNSPK